MPPRQSLRSLKWRSRVTGPSMYLAGTRASLSTTSVKQQQEIPRINLLLIEMAGKFHYTWIKNLNRLLYDQSKHRETEPPVEYRGPDAAEHFLQALQGEEREITGVLADPKAIRITREDWLAFRAATTCHM